MWIWLDLSPSCPSFLVLCCLAWLGPASLLQGQGGWPTCLTAHGSCPDLSEAPVSHRRESEVIAIEHISQHLALQSSHGCYQLQLLQNELFILCSTSVKVQGP